MRRTLSLLGLSVVAILLAACSGGPTPGWTYAPASPSAAASGSPGASASASPSASASAPASASASPSASAPASASAAPSPSASGSAPAPSASAGGLTLVARNVTFAPLELTVPADQPFQITLDNQDAGVPHDIDIRQNGAPVQGGDQQFFSGVAQQTYDYPALPAGTYEFICSVHPIPAMTGTLTVQ